MCGRGVTDLRERVELSLEEITLTVEIFKLASDQRMAGAVIQARQEDSRERGSGQAEDGGYERQRTRSLARRSWRARERALAEGEALALRGSFWYSTLG